MTPTRREVLRLSLAVLAASSTGAFGTPLQGLAPAHARALFDAIVDGDVSRVSELLAADPGLAQSRDASGRSGYALAWLSDAFGEGSQDSPARRIAELLVEAGYRRDLVETCLARDWEAISEFPFSAEGVEAGHGVGASAMPVAARRGIGSDVWRLYALGGDPNRFVGDPPVLAALDFPDLPTAEMTAATLLGNGADPRLQRPDGTTALHVASARGSAELVELLLRVGADVEAMDDAGHNALHYARTHGQRSCLELLERPQQIPREHSTSRESYDVNGDPYRPPSIEDLEPQVRGRTVGVSHGDLDAVRELILTEPRLVHSRATTTEGAVEACAHTGRLPVVEFLLENGAPYSLPTAVMRNDLARVRALLDEDPLRIHERGAHGFALLWYPVIGGGHLEMTQLLLERGCQVEDQQFLGTTALHWAAMRGQDDMVALLLENGGDAHRPGRKFGADPATPIELAQARGHEKTAALLSSSQ